MRYELVDDVLHGTVMADIVEWVTLVDHQLTPRTLIVLLYVKVPNQATLTNCKRNDRKYRGLPSLASDGLSFRVESADSEDFMDCGFYRLQISLIL